MVLLKIAIYEMPTKESFDILFRDLRRRWRDARFGLINDSTP
jgi:hypothetical protein